MALRSDSGPSCLEPAVGTLGVGRFSRTWTSVRQWPGMRSEYSWPAPSSGQAGAGGLVQRAQLVGVRVGGPDY
jgi:hypothetical protein